MYWPHRHHCQRTNVPMCVYQSCISILVPLRYNMAVNKLICNSELRNSQEVSLCNKKLLLKCNLPYTCGTNACHSKIPAMIQR